MAWITDLVSMLARCIPLTTVIGSHGTPYPCATVSAVDQHISRLYEHIAKTGPQTEVVEELWADIDLLLDHRMWLELDLGVSDDA